MSDECEPQRMDSLNNPFTHYTEQGSLFKMQRLSRIKSIASAMKRGAQKRIQDRNDRVGELPCARMASTTPTLESEENGEYSVEQPNNNAVRRFSKSLRKLDRKKVNQGQNTKTSTAVVEEKESINTSINTPLLQQKH